GLAMTTRFPSVLTLAALVGALALTSPAPAQNLPAAPVPVAPSGDAPPPRGLIGPPVDLGRPLTDAPAAAPPIAGPPPPPAPPPGPLCNDPCTPLDCEVLFFSTELAVLFPTVKSHLAHDVTLPNGVTYHVDVPRSELPALVAPDFIIGFRLPDNQ